MPIVESKKRNSILGSLALLAGFGAIALSAIDVSGLPTVNAGAWTLPFALALDVGVGALALVAFLLSAKSRRTGTEIPGAALVVAIAAGGIFYFRHRPPPAPVTAPHTAIPATAPAVTTSLPRTPPPKTVLKSPASPAASPSVAQATNAAKGATQQSVAAAAALARQQQLVALQSAKAQFAEAQARVITSLQSGSNYQQAKMRADTADSQLRDARARYSPGDSNLVAASQTALDARDALNQIVAQAMANDPAAVAAKAKLDALTQHQP